METVRADSLLSVLLFLNLNVFCSDGETKIRAKPGQNAILPCRAAEKKPVIVLDWSRTDLGEKEPVALYRDNTLYYHGQHPAYRGRVDLQDREMKGGNVSLLLKNVTINDKGTYECQVVQREKRRKRSNLDSDPICIINLDVSPPGNPGKQDDHEKNSGPIVGLSVGVSIVVLALVGGIVSFLLNKRQRRPQQQQNARPSAAKLQPMNAGTPDEQNQSPEVEEELQPMKAENDPEADQEES